MKYNIYQIQVTDEISNYVNSNDRGHTGAAEKFPLYNAKMETMHGRGDDRKIDFNTEYFSHYTKVCEVDGRYCGLSNGDMDYTVKSKNEVFAILNQQYLDEDTMEDVVFDSHVSGYTMKSFVREGKTIEYRNMHSLSVGDIVAEVPQVGYEVMEVADIVKQTRYFIVEGSGFTDITNIIDNSDVAVNRIAEAV
ncbi:hypothetical protein N9C44_01810 [bacterium]|nr:hypothetical protein [bacterium]|tara:strand:- start:3420 stop:3998 length:579 start_codon:yes stop_codon:yes gene_type:complete